MAAAAIAAEGLGRCYGPEVALDGVDLEPPAGGVLGALGPNRSGTALPGPVAAPRCTAQPGRRRADNHRQRHARVPVPPHARCRPRRRRTGGGSWAGVLLAHPAARPGCPRPRAGRAGRTVPVIVLFFNSSDLMPVAAMPGWLQALAKANPITVITDRLRALCLGGPTTRPAIQAAARIAALLAVTVPAAITRYRHAIST